MFGRKYNQMNINYLIIKQLGNRPDRRGKKAIA
jgi:hypothetical protein